jgi:hypothetical protein
MSDFQSIYQRQLGKEAFARLHPMIQRRFGFDSTSGISAIGRGAMHRVWHGRWYTLPFLWFGTWRSIMFPEQGNEIPFTIENYAYKDSFGRETVTWLRTFTLGRRRRFDAYMIYSQQRKLIVDYLGTHQHLAVDIDISVAPNGGLQLRSGEQRFYEGPVGFRFPMLFSGRAEVCEWYDDEQQCFRIEVVVGNRWWGKLFGYTGSFQVEWQQTLLPPAEARPRRTERRE